MDRYASAYSGSWFDQVASSEMLHESQGCRWLPGELDYQALHLLVVW